MLSDPAAPRLVAELEATTHAVLDHLAQVLAPIELTHGEITALFHLREGASLRVQQLTALTGQRPSTMTGILRRLERRGLLVRARDPGDGRSTLVETTPEGARASRAVRDAFQGLETRAHAHVAPGAIVACLDVLAALRRSAAAAHQSSTLR